MAVIWLVAVTTMVAGGVRAARHRAHAAADGAALAAASHAAEGSVIACRIAAAVAAGTGARLTGCVLRAPSADGTDGGGGRWGGGGGDGEIGVAVGQVVAEVSVVVIYRGPGWLGGALRIPARASAAPVALAGRTCADMAPYPFRYDTQSDIKDDSRYQSLVCHLSVKYRHQPVIYAAVSAQVPGSAAATSMVVPGVGRIGLAKALRGRHARRRDWRCDEHR
jgi:hypothetical protein